MSKIVLITGASSGIGKSMAEYLFQKGMTVYGTSRDSEKNTSPIIKMISLDITDVASIQKAIETLIKKEGKIDVLVNNAGMGITGPIEDTPTTEMRTVFNTNVFGAIDLCKVVFAAYEGAG